MNLDHNPGESKLTARRKAEYRSLHRSKGRRDTGEYLIEGVRLVESALQARAMLRDMVVTEEALASPRIAAIAEQAPCPVLIAGSRDLKAISDVRSDQGIVASVRLPKPPAGVRGRCVILDGVQDPGNVGTVIRSAAWFGIETVICGPSTADPFQPKVVRSTQGGLWQVDLIRCGDEQKLLALLDGYTVCLADMKGIPMAGWTPEKKTALVLGSEAHGPSQVLRQRADEAVTIPGARPRQEWQDDGPGSHPTESLNAAVAGGILMQFWASV